MNPFIIMIITSISIVACQSSNNNDTNPDNSNTTTIIQNPDCPLNNGQPGSSVAQNIEFNGKNRTYQIHLPTNYDCTDRPLIIGFHGYYGNGKDFEENTSEMFSTIDDRGYIGIFPDGLQMSDSGWQADVTSFNDIDSHNSSGSDGPTCTEDAFDYGVYQNCPTNEGLDACNWGTSCADDEGFIRYLIEYTKNTWSIDSNRIFMTGFSQGGQTTQSLAWRLSDIIAAVSPQHGFSANGFTVSPPVPIGLFQVWGTTDRIVDGNDTPSNDGMIYDGASETALIWADGLGCNLDPTVYATPYDGIEGFTCEEYANCPSGKKVVSCSWDGGHRWGKSGNTNFALLAMLDFFELHSL